MCRQLDEEANYSLSLIDRIVKDGRKVINGTYGRMAASKMELKPSSLTMTRINEDGTKTEVDVNLKPMTEQQHVEDEEKQPAIEVAGIQADDEDSSVSDETKERMLPMIDA